MPEKPKAPPPAPNSERERVAELEKQSRFLYSILHNIPNMIFVKEAKELRFVLFNRAGEELLGMKNTELIGRNDYDFFPKDQADFFTQKDRSVLEQQKMLDIPEEPIDTRSGRRMLHTKKIPIEDADGKPAFLLGISEDITELKQREWIIEQQRQALVNASKFSALGEMAGGIAHEINNPLAIISGAAQRIEKILAKPDLDRKELGELTKKLVETSDRIARIIRGLRDFSRDGSTDPYLPASVAAIVESTLGFCREKLKNRQIDLRVDEIPADLEIECQDTKISQILLNLILNAVDAVTDAKEKRIEIRLEERPDSIRLSVLDSGVGIPPELATRVMQPFFTTKPPGKGTGLGLSISKGIAESHGGSLQYNGRKGMTCFTVELPRHHEHATKAA